MNILVIGCGKVGSKLACVLDKLGHDVCIVDRDPDTFERLDNDFSGYTVSGVPIDQNVLRRAGIESSDVVVAVTQDDNVNIMVSQLAKEIFSVKQVLTRIYDPARENVYSHFELNTVCPTNMTVDAVCALLKDSLDLREMSFGASTVGFLTVLAERHHVGKRMSEISLEPGSLLFGAQAVNGRFTLASDERYTVREDDRLVFAKLI